ncbi:MAG: DNA mismatch repair protein MutS, partial [Bacteroidales bacterium]
EEGISIKIKNGRHPVIEKQLPPGESYVANDIYLDNEKQQIMIITGPNMSGKSALLRQTALIVLMAQMGCFVPAEAAEIGIVDKVFTRVGASDNISTGESTFMVEMNETASILNNISSKCLILLDEIGRGTSTYDGVSIAWSIAEFLHEHKQYRAKVLFATHYHELNDMADQFSRIKNFHVSVKEINNKILFLRKLEKGGSEHSFGIHVARMAGMPQQVLRRADEVLQQLEESRSGNEKQKTVISKKETGYQLSFIALDDPLLLDIKDQIVDLDIDSLTPVEALMKLNDIKKKLVKKK